VPNASFTIDEEGGRQRANAAVISGDPWRRHGDRKGDAALVEKALDAGGARAVGGEADDHEAIVLLLLVYALESRHFDAARRTPGCPEIDQYDLPAKAFERDFLAVECGDGESRGFVAGRTDGEGGRYLRPDAPAHESEDGYPEKGFERTDEPRGEEFFCHHRVVALSCAETALQAGFHSASKEAHSSLRTPMPPMISESR
jgi:hypothetical protein